MAAFLWLPSYIQHPLSSNGASFYGGIGGDLGYLTIAAAIVARGIATYRQHQCHVERCWRPSWHADPKHGHPVCKRHHSETGRCVPDPDGGSMMLEEEM